MAIARDSGSSFPVTDGFTSTNVSSRTSPAFSTSAASCLIVVTLGWANNSVAAAPFTCTWSGGTPSGASTFTQVVSAALTGATAANFAGSSVWVATTTSAITSKSIVITATTADTIQAMALAIDALTGASATVTNTGSVASVNAAAVNRFITLAGVAGGSWLYVGYSDGSTGAALTTQSGTTTAKESLVASSLNADCGYNSSGTSGSISVGWTGTAAFAATCAAEIAASGGITPQDFEQHTMGRPLPRWNPERSAYAWGITTAIATVPPKNGPFKTAVLPDFFLRTRWEPERTHLARAGWTQATWAIAPTWTPAPVLPDLNMRPAWNPERTENDRAGWTQALWAIPPAKRPDPVLPESFARPRWNPDRADVFWNSRLFVAIPAWGYEMLGPQRFFPAWNPERSHSAGIPYLPPTWPTTVVVPEWFARTAWSPERSHNVGIPYLPPTWPTTVVAPEWFARPRWNPERTEAARAGWTQALWAIAPTKIPEPVLPENYARPIWNPERSHIFVRQFVVSAVAPTWGYELYGPQGFLRPPWNPERSHLARAGWTQATWAVPPQQIPEPVSPPSYARPLWSPERSAVLAPPRIVSVPLLSWTPALLDRYVQALRSNPWLDLFLPPFPQSLPISPSQLIVLVGVQAATATSGQQDAVSLLGQQAPAGVQGSQDTIVILGRQDTGPLSGSQ